MNDDLQRLIGMIYETAGDRQGYDQVASEMLRLTNSRLILLPVYDRARRSIVAAVHFGDITGRVETGLHDWVAGAFASDPTIAFTAANPGATMFATDLHMTREAHRHDDFIAWSRDRIGTGHWTAVFAERDGAQFGASVHARGADEPHDARERAIFVALFDHLTRAQRMGTRTLDLGLSDEVTITLNAAGKVTGATPAAEAMLTRGAGITVRGGELSPTAPAKKHEFDALIRAALRGDPARRREGGMMLPLPGGEKEIVVLVAPGRDYAVPLDLHFGAVVRIVDPEAAPRRSAARVRRTWRLTEAEARLADMLLETRFDLRAAADRLGVTYATARTQLARVFAKTGTHSQPELARLLTRLLG
ncbi:MAG TPA: hypothetical protein VF592_04505 [Sphingomonas sp.]|uniref:helix-turn-helix transcriptional regulator n=1 Tax=Sphingomonas sp. TaxID=28214 RepID=UPI002ED7BE52